MSLTDLLDIGIPYPVMPSAYLDFSRKSELEDVFTNHLNDLLLYCHHFNSFYQLEGADLVILQNPRGAHINYDSFSVSDIKAIITQYVTDTLRSLCFFSRVFSKSILTTTSATTAAEKEPIAPAIVKAESKPIAPSPAACSLF
jgi:hypothetical protein